MRVTIGLVQTSVSTDVERNLRKTIARIKAAAKAGAQVICLQELYRTRYFPSDPKSEVAHLAESVPGESTAAFTELARRLNVVIIAPIFERADDGTFYNSAVVIDADGAIAGTYRKIHIPHDPFFYEQSYFAVGDRGFCVFETRHLRFAVLICYDQWFPEAARSAALQGADVIFYPTAIGHFIDDPLPASEWSDAWETIQRGHAIANSVHVAVVNRVGIEGSVRFWGASFVAGPFGKLIRKAGSQEEILLAELDISKNSRIREGWRFMKNRQPATYKSICEPVVADTPAASGLLMPAEWEPHQSTWLAWPYDPVTFPRRVPKVEERYVEIIAALASGELVNLVVRDSKVRTRVRSMLKAAGTDLRNVAFHIWDYADVWFRDYGPTFVVDSARSREAVVHWNFNAWGEKYKELVRDGQAPYCISERLRLPYFRPGIVLEGGAIDVNGQGTLLTTEQCLLNENRNPGTSKRDLENILHDYLGVKHVIWLKRGIAGDDTDGHIDNLARFVSADTVLSSYESDTRDENFEALHENFELLRGSKTQDGVPLNVVKLPMPPAMTANVRGQKRRLSASYANFYIGNKVVLVPAFGHERDQEAMGIIGSFFSGRKIVAIDCRDVVYGSGALHCITQQQPAAGLH